MQKGLKLAVLSAIFVMPLLIPTTLFRGIGTL